MSEFTISFHTTQGGRKCYGVICKDGIEVWRDRPWPADGSAQQGGYAQLAKLKEEDKAAEPPRLPPCCYAEPGDEPGKQFYATYNRAGDRPGLNYKDLPCPLWEDLPKDIRTKWRAAAKAKAEATKVDPDICPNTRRSHAWQDSSKNTIVACTTCGKIR
jgi:hypothetical protein